MKESNFDLYESFGDDFWYTKCRQDLIEKILKKHVFASKRKATKKNIKILDVGCGIGMNYKALRSFGTVYNVDIDKKAVKICKKRGLKNVSIGDAQNLKKFKSKQFDLVTGIELVEHLPKDSLFIKEASRVLKDKGHLIISAPAFKFLWSEDDELAYHYRRYSVKQIKALVQSKFDIRLLSFRYFFLFPFSLIIFFALKLKKILGGQSTNSLATTPKFFNSVLNSIMTFENTLISQNIKMPFGVGFVVLCQKR